MSDTIANELEIPAFLLIPAEERRAAWERCPPRPMPSFDTAQRRIAEDPATIELRRQSEENKARKAQAEKARLNALKARKAAERAEEDAVRAAARAR